MVLDNGTDKHAHKLRQQHSCMALPSEVADLGNMVQQSLLYKKRTIKCIYNKK